MVNQKILINEIYIYILLKFFLLNLNATYAREIGQTEITADNGVDISR